jgi:cyclic pyranopterin phosphate synthase
MDGRLLTLDLGNRCNNRCLFCPQHYLRGGRLAFPDLTTAQVEERIREARRTGHDRLAFTGGEPTVREDLPRLVRYASQQGFREIGITTNARMLAVESLSADLLAAGLNRVTFSLHSADPATHDRLSGVAGAQAQLAQGLRTLHALAATRPIPLVTHSVTLLLPETVAGLPATIAAAKALGAEIHVLQPFIASRANLHVAQTYFVDYPALASAVTAAGRLAATIGTRVKPYNIPYCLLGSLEGLELQSYGLATHRRQERQLHSERSFGQRQFFPVERCPTCPTPCPGFRIEHYPRARMAEEILEETMRGGNFSGAAGGTATSGRAILPGMDLLPALEMEWLLARLGEAGIAVTPLVGGNQWCSPEDFVALLGRVGAPEVGHLFRSEWEGAPATGEEPDLGNEEALMDLAHACKQAGLRNTLLLAALDLPELPYTREQVAAQFDRVVIAFPNVWRGLPGERALGDRLREAGPRAFAAADSLAAATRVSVALFENVRTLARPVAQWQRAFAARYPTEEWSLSLRRHSFADPRYNFVMWSFPFWLF